MPTFTQAVRELPKCITGIDFVGQHKTVADLVASVQFLIDIYCEGEPERDTWTQKYLGRCRKYVEKFGMEEKVFDMSTEAGIKAAEKYKARLENTYDKVATTPVGLNRVRIHGAR